MALISAQMPNDTSGDACTLIKGLSIQPARSDEAKIAALPFTLADLGGFQVWQTVGGSGIILSNGDETNGHVADSSPMVVVARAFADRNTSPKEQLNFSVEWLKATTAFENAKIVSQQMVTGATVPTSEIIVETDDKKAVQWIQFQLWQMVPSVPLQMRPKRISMPCFRALRPFKMALLRARVTRSQNDVKKAR